MDLCENLPGFPDDETDRLKSPTISWLSGVETLYIVVRCFPKRLLGKIWEKSRSFLDWENQFFPEISGGSMIGTSVFFYWTILYEDAMTFLCSRTSVLRLMPVMRSTCVYDFPCASRSMASLR